MAAFINYGAFNFIGVSGYPVPQISISTEQIRNGDGSPIGSTSTISLEGIIYCTGSLAEDRGFDYLTSREKRLRETFSCDGQLLLIGCSGGTGPNSSTSSVISGYPRVTRYNAEKTENHWASTISYSIELQIPNTGSGNNRYLVSSTQNEFNIENIDEFSYVNSPVGAGALRSALSLRNTSGYPVYRISRTLGAVGLYFPSGASCSGGSAPSTSAVENAKKWVLDNAATGLGLSGMLSGLELFNLSRSININQNEGSYRLTDNFFGIQSGAFSGYFTESFNAESSLDNTYLRTVTVNGTIKGLEPFSTGNLYTVATLGSGASGSLLPFMSGTRVPSTSKFNNALSGYSGIKSTLFQRAQCFLSRSGDTLGGPGSSGIFVGRFGRDEPSLNPVPVSIVEGYNPAEGSVTYSYVYNNRPLNLVSGSISETLTINDTFPSQQVAEIFVLGRRLGPVIQDLGTFTSATRDVTFEVTMLRPSGLSGLRFPKSAYSDITGIIETFNPENLVTAPAGGYNPPCKAFVKNNTENWNVTEGRFVKTKSWVWAKCSDVTNANIQVIG